MMEILSIWLSHRAPQIAAINVIRLRTCHQTTYKQFCYSKFLNKFDGTVLVIGSYTKTDRITNELTWATTIHLYFFVSILSSINWLSFWFSLWLFGCYVGNILTYDSKMHESFEVKCNTREHTFQVVRYEITLHLCKQMLKNICYFAEWWMIFLL